MDYSTFDGPGPHNIDPDLMYTTLPSHVLMMGFAHGRDGHYIFFDTERATWTVCDFQVGPQQDWTEMSEVSAFCTVGCGDGADVPGSGGCGESRCEDR